MIFKTALLSILGLISCHAIWAQSKSIDAEKYAATIKAEDLKQRLFIIASDSMQGRMTGEEGQKKASKYIAQHFAKHGLEPVVEGKSGKSYFQTFTLNDTKWDADNMYIKTQKDKLVYKEHFFALGSGSVPEEKKFDLTFIGYAYQGEDYDDFKDKDLKGKAVIFFSGQPEFANDQSDAGDQLDKIYASGANLIIRILGKDQEEFRSRVVKNAYFLDRTQMEMSQEKTPQLFLFVSMDAAAQMLRIPLKKLEAIKEKINSSKDQKYDVKTTEIALKLGKKTVKEVFTENVVGYMEGSDKKDEIVIISAHYDHVGAKDGEIYNGADDNGSGTSTILELVEAFSKAKEEGLGPRRSLLFISLTGEELGLYGSQYYADVEPLFPLENTVVDLNIDMIGRIDKHHEADSNYVYLIGSDKLSMDLHRLSERMNSTYTGLNLDYTYNDENDPNRFYYRSDHYNFAKHGIPIIFYFSGVHEDYHQPSDTPDKIMYQKLAKIGKLVFYTAWEIANREERLLVDEK